MNGSTISRAWLANKMIAGVLTGVVFDATGSRRSSSTVAVAVAFLIVVTVVVVVVVVLAIVLVVVVVRAIVVGFGEL